MVELLIGRYARSPGLSHRERQIDHGKSGLDRDLSLLQSQLVSDPDPPSPRADSHKMCSSKSLSEPSGFSVRSEQELSAF